MILYSFQDDQSVSVIERLGTFLVNRVGSIKPVDETDIATAQEPFSGVKLIY